MARAVLPNPSARAEWLFAGVIDRSPAPLGACPSLDGWPGDYDLDDFEIDSTIPDDDDDTVSLASCTYGSVWPSSLQLPGLSPCEEGRGCCWPTMALPRNEQDPQRLRSTLLCGNLHLENSFEDNGVGGHVLDLLALEDDVFQWCLSAQLDPTALQRSNRGKCAHLLRDLDATADLPPHCPLLALQLLDLTHRWWSDSEGPDIEEGDVFTLAAAAYIGIKLHSALYPDSAPFLLPDPRQPARSLTDLLTALAATPGQAPTSLRATSAHSPGCA